MYIRIEPLQEIYMPRRYGRDTIGSGKNAIATTDICRLISFAKRSCPPLAVRLILCIRYLLVQIAYVYKEWNVPTSCKVGGGTQRKSGESGTKNDVEMLTNRLFLQPFRETSVAPIGEQRPKCAECPMERSLRSRFLIYRVGVSEVVCLELLCINRNVISLI